MINLNNTCFIGSALTCLLNIRHTIGAGQRGGQHAHDGVQEEEEKELLEALVADFQAYYNTAVPESIAGAPSEMDDGPPMRPTRTVGVLRRQMQQEANEPGDAVEVLMRLLDAINPVNGGSDGHTVGRKSQTACTACEYRGTEHDEVLFPLHAMTLCDVEAALMIDGAEHIADSICEGCQAKGSYERRERTVRLPTSVLVITVAHVDETHIRTLLADGPLREPLAGGIMDKYTLCGAVLGHGNLRGSGGHYSAIIWEASEGEWWHVDDAHVRLVSGDVAVGLLCQMVCLLCDVCSRETLEVGSRSHGLS